MITFTLCNALLASDCHLTLESKRAKLRWAADVAAQLDDRTEPGGRLLGWILDYDSAFGRCPNAEEIQSYVTLRKSKGKNSGNQETCAKEIKALMEYVVSQTGLPTDVNSIIPVFLETQQKAFHTNLLNQAVHVSAGGEVYDRDTKKTRSGTYHDAINILKKSWAVNDLPEDEKPVANDSLEIPEGAVYGWLGQKARESGMPMGLIYPALLSVYSAAGITLKNTHPSLYVALLGDVECGKSQAIERAEMILGARDFGEPGGTICHIAVSSDRGLFKVFNKPERMGKSFTMSLSELRYMFTKMSIQKFESARSVVPTMGFQKILVRRIKEKSLAARLRSHFLGGLKCADASEFSEVFGAQMMHGLYCRFIFGLSTQKWTYMPTEIQGERRRPAKIYIPTERWLELDEWRNAAPGRNRLAEIVMRIAAVSESAELGGGDVWIKESEIALGIIESALDVMQQTDSQTQTYSFEPQPLSQAALRAAIGFTEWQERIRSSYRPGKALNQDAQCTETLRAYLTKTGGFKWSLAQRNLHLSDKFGATTVKRVRESMIVNHEINYNRDTGYITPVLD